METFYIKDKNFIKFNEPLCAAIGNFDGVHLGHQELIKESKKYGYKSALITFNPHPTFFIKNMINHPLITPLKIKQRIIEEFNLDYLIIIDFTSDIANMEKDEFMDILASMNVRAIVCGYDFTFGKMALGNISDLSKRFEVHEVKKYTYDNVRVSSSLIRELLSYGNIQSVNRFLGRRYEISGDIIHGLKNGKLFGFPTINIDYENFYLPKTGVYFVEVLIDNIKYYGMANIGHNPTIEYSDIIKLEVHIFDFDLDVYGKNASISFIERIRDEKRFDSANDLIEELKKNKNTCIELIKNL